MSLNAVWHATHRLGKNPTPKQRLEWHLEHEKVCGCRKLTQEMREKLEEEVKRRSS